MFHSCSIYVLWFFSSFLDTSTLFVTFPCLCSCLLVLLFSSWYINFVCNLSYPISTLPEHLHSTSLSHAETTWKHTMHKETLFLPSYRSLPVSRSPTPPFTGRPGHTHTYPSFLVSAPRKPVVLLVALTRYVCFALKALKLPVFSFELTLLTFSVSYLWIISYMYIHT